MIRKGLMLVVVSIFFVYACWNLYVKAVAYDPLTEVLVKKIRKQEPVEAPPAQYKAAWSSDIFEKNLFSPVRTYMEPKPVVVMPTSVVEPPRRPEMVLKGIVLDTFGEYVAYLEINKVKATPIRKGDKVDDIELVDITNRDVVLKWNGETIKLSIDKIKTITNPKANK